MDPQLQSEPIQQPMVPLPPIPTSSGLPKILLIAIALIVIVGIGFGAYILGVNKGKLAVQSEQKQQTTIIPTPTLLPSEVLTKEGDPTANWKTYTDSKIIFKYPPNWEVLDKVPEKFRVKPSYIESGNIEEWLSGKMFGESCRGPVLQNTSDTNQLIAFEIVDTKGDGGFCWSMGYFMDGNKWKVSERYVYPAGSNNQREPEWKGDYFKMEKAATNGQFMAIVALVNYETFQLRGKDVLQSIISSFKFTQ